MVLGFVSAKLGLRQAFYLSHLPPKQAALRNRHLSAGRSSEGANAFGSRLQQNCVGFASISLAAGNKLCLMVLDIINEILDC